MHTLLNALHLGFESAQPVMILMHSVFSMSVLSLDDEGFPESVSLLAHLVLDGLPLRFAGTLHTRTRAGRAALITLPVPM